MLKDPFVITKFKSVLAPIHIMVCQILTKTRNYLVFVIFVCVSFYLRICSLQKYFSPIYLHVIKYSFLELLVQNAPWFGQNASLNGRMPLGTKENTKIRRFLIFVLKKL